MKKHIIDWTPFCIFFSLKLTSSSLFTTIHHLLQCEGTYFQYAFIRLCYVQLSSISPDIFPWFRPSIFQPFTLKHFLAHLQFNTIYKRIRKSHNTYTYIIILYYIINLRISTSSTNFSYNFLINWIKKKTRAID